MSLVCPSCGSEYRAGITRCASCQVDLVEASAAPTGGRGKSGRELLASKKTVVVPQANLGACRDLELLILDAGYPCYVHAEEADIDVALGSTGAVLYGVVVAEDDVPAIQAHLKGRFEASLAAQGLGALQTEVVHVDDGEVTCPACGHRGVLLEGNCADCGLFLGANE